MNNKLRLLMLLFIILAALLTSCMGTNYSRKGWVEAFDLMHEEVSREYPFTELKRIDWDALYDQTMPEIRQAEANQDKTQYYLAMKKYALSIPDYHVVLAGEDFGLRKKYSGAGYGFGIIKLDDSRYIAHVLLEDGPALQSGMQWGAEILQWNDRPIEEAVQQASLLWAERMHPTQEGQFLERCRYLLRAQVGDTTTVTFMNPNENDSQTVTMIAKADDSEHLKKTAVGIKPNKSLVRSPIQSRMITDEIGYIGIASLMPNFFSWHLNSHFRNALKKCLKQNAKALILDVRGNEGGLDKLASQIAGYFYQEQDFYEAITYYSETADSFVIKLDETLLIEPQNPYFDGPIAVLVDKGTVSSAEGIPLTLQRLKNGVVIGQHGTNGSFAMSTFGTLYRLPEGLAFLFFEGRSLDKNNQIQVDANWEGEGGITPDVCVPVTVEQVEAQYRQGKDVILQAAIEYLQNNQLNEM